ncbi:MAG: hypothetical protein GYB31_01960 [Bacteroidetes bacterium]|nr:hypothetical protein [Bacteroidota bacterium]
MNYPAFSRFGRLITSIVALYALSLFISPQKAYSQPTSFGIGAQIGSPTGLSLHFGAQGRPSYDLLLAWDLNDYLFANLHFMYENPLAGNNFTWFYGPGVFAGIEGDWDGPPKGLDGNLYMGVSGTIGLSAYFDIFQIYLRATPRLQLLDKTAGHIGGGLGLRFYL